MKLSERRTLGTGTPLPLGQCRRRWSRAPTGQRDGVAWRRRGQDTVDTLDETCTSTECRRERGGRSEERGARSEEPGARSQEPGARSQERGARGEERGLGVDFTMWGEETRSLSPTRVAEHSPTTTDRTISP